MERRDLELAALLVLLRRRPGGAGWNEIAIEVAARRSAIEALAELPSDTLFADSEIEAWLEDAQQTVRQWRSAGYHLVTVLDEDFPQRLLEIRETPPFLFYEGELREPDPGVSVVGSAVPYGCRFLLSPRVPRTPETWRKYFSRRAVAARALTIVPVRADKFGV